MVSAVTLAAVVAVYTAQLRTAVGHANENATEAGRQRGLALNNYRAARDALKRMLRRLDDRRAGEFPHLRELRRDQLEDALSFYQGVLDGAADPDPAVQFDTALAAAEAGTIQYTLGPTGPAEETLRRAVGLFETLPAESRTSFDCRTGLIHCYNFLADLADERPGETERFFLKARAEAEELVRVDPADPVRQNTLARVEHNLGTCFLSRKRTDLAEEHHLRAVAIRTGLLDRLPQADPIRADLGEDLIHLGLLYTQTNRPDRAAEAFQKAESLLRPLAQAHPADDRYALSLAGVYINWGNLLRFSGDRPGGLAKFDRAVALADAVLGREPQFSTARERATEAHGARAYARAEANRPADAVPDWDRVIDLVAPADRDRYRACRAAALAASRQYARAAAEAHALTGVSGIGDDDRYTLACALALAVKPTLAVPRFGVLAAVAEAEGHAAAAVRVLRRLHTDGYFRQPRRALLLATDPGLHSLRTRPDFRGLVADITTGPKP